MSDKSLRIAFVIISLAFLWTFLRLDMKTQEFNSKIKIMELQKDTLQKERDSLYDENFPCQIEVGRYQVAYQIFMERNPKAASQFGDIISKETE